MSAMQSRMKSNVYHEGYQFPSFPLLFLSRQRWKWKEDGIIVGWEIRKPREGEEKKMSFMYVVPSKCIKTS